MGQIVLRQLRIMAAIAVLTFGTVTFAATGVSVPPPLESVAMVDQSRWMGHSIFVLSTKIFVL